jgi:thiazole synthase ThiGH ThiG subunit
MNADILITIVFVAEAALLAVLSGVLIFRSGFGSPRETGRTSSPVRHPGRLP